MWRGPGPGASHCFLFQGTHKSLKGNAHALSTVTAIIDGTGSVGMQRAAQSPSYLTGAQGSKGTLNSLALKTRAARGVKRGDANRGETHRPQMREQQECLVKGGDPSSVSGGALSPNTLGGSTKPCSEPLLPTREEGEGRQATP